MQKRFVTSGLVVALVLTAAVAGAQVQPAPYVIVHYDTIDPSMSAEYSANGKAWVKAFSEADAGEEFYWRAYQSGFTYAWVSDMPNYGFMDEAEAREKMLDEKLGEGVMSDLVAGANAAIIDHHTEIWKYEADMSYIPDNFDISGMTAINVSTDRVRASMRKEFAELVKEVVAAMKKINAPLNWFAYSIPFGQGDYAFVVWGKDRSSLHGGPDMGELLAQAVGPDKSQEMYNRYMKSVSHTEDRDWKVRGDLSYMSAAAADEAATEEKSE